MSFLVVNGQVTTKTTARPTTYYPSVSLNCDFEKDFCGYANYINDQSFYWQRNKGSALIDINGPLPDHTTQSLNGHYIYVQVKFILIVT